MGEKEQRSYDDFWSELSNYYPVSKGTLRLPVVTSPITIEGFNHSQLVKELGVLLQEMLSIYGTKSSAVERARDAQEEYITPLITDNFTGVVRFDCAIDDTTGDVKILEINCDYPDGLLMHDNTYSVLSDSQTTLHKDLLRILTDNAKHIHILHPENAFFLDAYQTEADFFKATIGSNLPSTTDELVVRRCREVSKFDAQTLREMAQTSAQYINSFALRTLGYKDLLASLPHTLVPQTYILNNENKPLIENNRERFIIKPKNGCEGANIYFGHTLEQSAWKALLDKKLSNNYIAQEFINMQRMEIDLYDTGEIVTKNLYYDICPHFFIKNGEVVGVGHTLMRFSENPVVNVSQGGGIGYYRLV